MTLLFSLKCIQLSSYKIAINFPDTWNETVGPEKNTFLISSSMYKILRFLFITFPSELCYGCYVATRGIFFNVLF